MGLDKKIYCRECYGERNQNLLFHKRLKGEDDSSGVIWIDNYYVIECKGCETLSFLKIYGDTDMYYVDDEGNQNYYDTENIYPEVIKGVKLLDSTYFLPPTIKIIYDETVEVIKTKSYILASAGLRTIIEAICTHLKIGTIEMNLLEKIDLLNDLGHLTLNESKRLHSIRFLANDALHEMKKPESGQVIALFKVINHLLENLFITDKKNEFYIEKIIDDYNGFIQLLKNRILEKDINKELNLKELLGKTIRRLKKKDLPNFEVKLNKQIELKEIDYLEIISKKSPRTYKITKVPDGNFGLF